MRSSLVHTDGLSFQFNVQISCCLLVYHEEYSGLDNKRSVERERRLLFILERKFFFVPLTSSSKSDSTVSLKSLQSIHHDPLFLFCCLLLSFHPHPSLLFLMSFAFLASFILCLDVCLSLDVASSSLFFVQLQLSSSSSSS